MTLKRALGFTLVELLVAMLLGVLLLFGVTQIFSSSREGARLQTAMASVQDGGRIAVELLSRDIRNADFSGCLRNKTSLINGLTGYAPGSEFEYYNLNAVDGAKAVAGTKVGTKDVKVDTDTLQIVAAVPVCDGVVNVGFDQADRGDPLTLSAACPTEINDGTVLLVSNCLAGEIFMKTGGIGNSIEHGTAAFDGVSNGSEDFDELYGTDATIMRPVVYTYFVAQGQNSLDALFRREDDTSYEIVPNVEDFQIEFGVDSDGDKGAETFVAAGSVADPEQIVAVRTTISVRSTELVNGNPIVRSYTSTTSIRNRTVTGG